MKQTYPLLTTLIVVAMALGIVVSISSFPPALAETAGSGHNHNNDLLSQSNQIKVLIGVIIFMFGAVIYWIKKYITSNDQKHDIHFKNNAIRTKEIQDTTLALKELIGEHRGRMSRNERWDDQK